ncbi:hypothetical protein NKH77_21470 [Streptomyces sp. M19]
MNDTPGWAPPGSSPSDDPERGLQGQGGTSQRDEDERQDQGGEPDRTPPGTRWSAQQPRRAPNSRRRAGSSRPGSVRPRGSNPATAGRLGSGLGRTPPAARPGVIPLRPLGVGEILDGAVATMRTHWRTVLGISLAVAFVTQAVVTVADGLWFQDTSGLDRIENDPDASLRETWDAASGSLTGGAVTLLIAVLGTIVTTGLLTVVVGRAVLGRSVTTAEAWHNTKPRLLPCAGCCSSCHCSSPPSSPWEWHRTVGRAGGAKDGGTALAILGGLAGAIVAVWLWVLLSLAAPR